MRRDSPGQASLEYILLFGAGALVALIAFLLLIFLGPYGGNLLQGNIQEYEKIDLCTGQSNAACNIFLDWATGLSSGATGFVAVNESDWRTLKIEGAKISFFCGSELCQLKDFKNPPTFFMFIPKKVVGASLAPCDVDSEVCIQTPSFHPCGDDLDPLTADDPNGICELEMDNFGFPSANDFGAVVDPSGTVKFGVGAGSLISPNLTGVQVALKVSQLTNGNPTDTGYDTHADKLSWYAGHPDHVGSSFQCTNLSNGAASSYVDFGCEFTAGCQPTTCPASDDGSALAAFCADPLNGLSFGSTEIICSDGSNHYSIPACVNSSGAENQPYILDSLGGNPFKGAVSTFDLSGLKSNITYVKGFEPRINVQLTDFKTTLSTCTTDASCQSDCAALQGMVSNIDFYSIVPPSDDFLLCKDLSVVGTPPLLITGMGSPVMTGYYDSDTDVRFCYADFSVYKSPEFTSLLANPSQPNIYLGMKAKPGTAIKVQSMFNDSTGVLSIYSFYFTK